ncbi:unnamed protein product (macronuclear) [Paramecium tetraurelia]|uniref:Ankyrin repeat domain-containing protein n=1 Tax=Paramecium tetraurelia TaxID=5888 RepID=A0DCW1_PARTE|nr:uncharacterized protein GSPATT00015737001 [Paramecium tetraurelia]CAK80878.1 unnamed protein product [Paramecium tetraurelia]|eukprot:XP_001448275.1 hypothetical protein (macronuclear) [Paramecium tetraurelia strain d4-2]
MWQEQNRIPKIERQVNHQHAPPDSFQGSLSDSSICNVDDTCREQQAIEIKQVTLQNFQSNNIEIVLPKKKEKIFSSKLKTCFVDQQYEENFIVNKMQTGVSEHITKNPFQSTQQPIRKLSDIPSVTDRESYSRQNSQIDLHSQKESKQNINSIKQVPIAGKIDRSKVAASYSQLASKLYYADQSPQIINNPQKLQQKALIVHQSLNKLNVAQSNLQSSLNINNCSPKSSNQKYVLSEQSECFQDLLKDKKQPQQSTQQSQTQQDQSHRQIEKILSDNEILFKQVNNGKQQIFTEGIKSEANILRQPIIAFKKHNTIVNFKHVIQSMLNNDVSKFQMLMKDSKFSYLNQHDILGNTILITVIKLYGFHKKYDELLKEVLKMNPDPFIKNKLTGWSAMDESLSQRSIYATALLFQQCYRIKRNEFVNQFYQLSTVLQQVPNFQLDMNWNFDSPLPFIKLLAPNDTIKLYKYKQQLRLDSTLVGFSKLQCKRRNMSLLFKQNKLYQINRSNQFYTDPLEELDTEEKKLIIYDILHSEPVSGALDITSCTIKQCVDWRGRKIIEQVGQYSCEKQRFDLKITYKSSYLKKNNDTQIKFAVERELYEEWILNDVSPNTDLLLNQKPKEQNETRTISLWICKNHSLQFKDFANIVSLLAKGNHLMEKLNGLFQRPEMQEIIELNGFPIKVQIPFQFSIHATIQCCNFVSLENAEELFTIPNIKYLPRKEAQKILQTKKKRLLLANLYL